MIYRLKNVHHARPDLCTFPQAQGLRKSASHRFSQFPNSSTTYPYGKQRRSCGTPNQTTLSANWIHGKRKAIYNRNIMNHSTYSTFISYHGSPPNPISAGRIAFHTSTREHLDLNSNDSNAETEYMNIDPSVLNGNSMREKLSVWQEKYEIREVLATNKTSAKNIDKGVDDCFYFDDDNNIRRRSEKEDEAEDDEQIITSQGDPLEGLAHDIDTLFYHPGDMIEIVKNGQEPTLAMYIDQYEDQIQLYTMNGRWLHQGKNDSAYTVSKFFPKEDVEALKPYLPKGPIDPDLLDQAHMVDLSVPRAVGGPIVTKMLTFWREAEDFYREHASDLDKIHQTISHPTDLRFATMDSIASTVLKKPSNRILETEKYAVRRALLYASFRVLADFRNYKQTSTYNILPSNDAKSYEEVLQWVRAYQDDVARNKSERPILEEDPRSGAVKVKSFVAKAKKLIAESRQLRDKTPYGNVSPVLKKYNQGAEEEQPLKLIHSTIFTEPDKDIISLFQGWVVTKKILGRQEFVSAASAILRAVDEYSDMDTNIMTGQLFLQEIGALLPYENRNIYDYSLVLPTSGISKPLKALNDKLHSIDKDDSFRLRDRMKEIRKDWGQLPVYCIDGEGTHEVDDGISVERVPTSETEYWVRVHVAHPSAFFGLRHPLALMAEHMTANCYFPEVTYSMLPQKLVNSQFSLQADRPTLTFSGKVNNEGELLEYNVQPGIIRNVTKMTPRAAGSYNHANKRPGGGKEYVVGDAAPRRYGDPAKLSRDQAEDLRLLKLIATARTHRRIRKGGRPWFANDMYISVSGAHDKILPRISMMRKGALFVANDPIIRMRAEGYTSPFAGFGESNVDLVAEHMMLAGEIAGRWCMDRNIPAIYRGTLANPRRLDEMTYQRDIIQPLENVDRPLKITEVLKYLKYACFSVNSTQPLPHMHTGIEVMAKVTSPIRRYTDLLLHWQINEALLHEAGSDKKIGQERLPFSEAHLKAAIKRITPRERLLSSLHTNASAHWVAQFFLRAFYFKECELPKTFRMLILNIKRLSPYCQGRILDFGFQASMIQPDKLHMGDEAMIGDIWEVHLEQVDCYRRVILFGPERLIQRDGEV